MKYKFWILTAVLIAFALYSGDATAQCAMCKGAAEANLKQGGGDPQGLNNGILYMLSMPYLLVGVIGFWWYRNRKKDQEQVTEMNENDFERLED